MQKYKKAQITTFEFADLQGTHVVSSGEFKPFEFENLTGETISSAKATEEDIRSERFFAKKNNFKIDNIVQDFRGLTDQEQNDLEMKIQEEVNKRLEKSFQEAFDEGLRQGKEEGLKQANSELEGVIQERIENLSQIITDVEEQTSKVIQNNQKDLYEFIKRFTKWITLKETSDSLYLETLLEKLILELNSRKNLIIKVGKDNFKDMPEVVSKVQARLGELSNTRIEIVPELNYPGIILESDNGLIDGSLENVFINIDKIFEQVIKHE